jgi:hypothetical protein
VLQIIEEKNPEEIKISKKLVRRMPGSFFLVTLVSTIFNLKKPIFPL